MKGCGFSLWRVLNVAEHFARRSKIETALRHDITDGRQHVVRAVDVGIQSRELVFKRIGNETLGGKVITFIWAHEVEHSIETGEAFKRCGVKVKSVLD